MEPLFLLFVILAPIAFFTLIEIMILKESYKKVLKYLIVLKCIELFYIISIGVKIWLIISAIIYFLFLIFDFYKKTINIKEFTISILLYFIDVILTVLILYKVMDSLPVM